MSKRSSQGLVVRMLGALVVVLALAAPAAAADKKAEAEVHYDQGKAYYKAGAFDLAIQEFLAGYKLDPRPGVLFNIARGYEELKDRNKAIEFYKKYIDLGASAAAGATEARARMVVLERQIKDEDEKRKADEAERERQRQLALNPPPAAPAMPAPVESTAPAAAPAATAPIASGPEAAVSVTATPASSPETAKKLKVAGLVTGGAGVVLVGVGAFFAVRASSLKSEINGDLAKGELTYSQVAAKESDMKSAQTMAVIGLAAGGVAVAGGAVLYYLGWSKTPHDGGTTAMLSPGVTPGGGSLLLSGTF